MKAEGSERERTCNFLIQGHRLSKVGEDVEGAGAGNQPPRSPIHGLLLWGQEQASCWLQVNRTGIAPSTAISWLWSLAKIPCLSESCILINVK